MTCKTLNEKLAEAYLFMKEAGITRLDGESHEGAARRLETQRREDAAMLSGEFAKQEDSADTFRGEDAEKRLALARAEARAAECLAAKEHFAGKLDAFLADLLHAEDVPSD